MSHDTTLHFSENPDYDFEIRTVLGLATAGGSEPGEVLAAVAGVRKGDHQAWYAAWSDLGDRTAAIAAKAAGINHRVSAADAYLRASSYLTVAVNAISSLKDSTLLLPTFQRQQAAWAGFLSQTSLDVTAVAIPYEGSTLPGQFFRSSSASEGARRTLVLVNGSDGSMAHLFSGTAAAALARGYDILMFDGPGQQTELFEQNVPFRPDWEAVLTPVFDFVSALDGVDSKHISVYGISQGGNWVARGLAFEHRFAAAITDPGVVDVAASWTAQIPKPLLKMLDGGASEKFDKDMELGMKFSPDTARTWQFRARPYGTTGYAETIQEVRKYTVTDVAAQITTPLLVLSPDGEQFWPGQAEQLANLTSSVSTLVRFTAEEGAAGHCQPMARALTAQRMFDWLDERLG